MVAHFTTSSVISCPDFMRGMNAMLPGAIRIFAVDEVDLAFHARFSATGKCYHYNIYTGKVQPPHLRLYSVHIARPLHIAAIKECLYILQGTHDFSSFENSGSRDKSILSGRGAVRTIYRTGLIEAEPSQLTFQFVGDGFLRNMIRNFIGTLLEVGQKQLSVVEFHEILQAKDRTKAAATAPAHGLFLKEVFYEQL
jgi:tRNA pseudouridine38-40 synthase